MIHTSFNQAYQLEAALLIKSANLFDNPILIFCPEESKLFLEKMGLKFEWRECPYTKTPTKYYVEKIDPNSVFFRQKYGNFETVVREFGQGTYVGADVVFVDHCEFDFPQYDLALSPHHISGEKERAFGRYNADLIWTNTPRSIAWLRHNMYRSTYAEQSPWTFANEEFIVKELDMGYHMGWYRFSHDHNRGDIVEKRCRAFKWENDGLWFGNEKVKSLHTHFINRGQHSFCDWFNKFALSLLRDGTSTHKELAHFIEHV